MSIRSGEKTHGLRRHHIVVHIQMVTIRRSATTGAVSGNEDTAEGSGGWDWVPEHAYV